MRILVVEDEEMVRTICVAMLRRLEYQTLEASDGLEAMQIFKQYQHDILGVVLDLTMPRMDGLATFDALRQIRPDVQVLLCSGYSETEATRRFMDKPLAGFIQKPFQLGALRETLGKLRGCA